MAQKGDFIGFTFGDVHSSSYGIVRTSNGSRYNTNLLPQSQDQTVAVPGGDGVYFFGSNYTTRSFQLQIASDEISEMQLRQIKQWLGDKQLHDLIFDEVPYKVYTAKCTGMPQFNFLCFDENGGRVYKGEGSIEFTAYYPFARSRYKFLDDYIYPRDFTTWTYSVEEWSSIYSSLYIKVNNVYVKNTNSTYDSETTYYVGSGYGNVPEWNGNQYVAQGVIHNHQLGSENVALHDLKNIDEWKVSSEMLQNDHSGATGITYDDLNGQAPNQVYVYNPGDIEADFQLWFVPNVATGLQYYKDNNTGDSTRHLYFDFSGLGNDMPAFIQYDSKTELLTGYTANNGVIGSPNGKLYNKYITKGDFFKIPTMDTAGTTKIVLDCSTSASYIAKLEYNYLYI